MKKIVFLPFLFVLIISCNNNKERIDLKKIHVDTEIERFDSLLFEMNTDTIGEGITWLYKEYDDFLDIFSYYIINIGYPGEKEYALYLSRFINDRLNREVYLACREKFRDLSATRKALNDAFKRYRYYFPDDSIPRLVSFISRFNSQGFTVGNYLGIGLDMYLGAGSEFYSRMRIPEYRKVTMIPEKIPSDALNTWGAELFPYNDSVDNVLSHIIHEGKLMYFISRLLPDQPDSLLIGFTEDQMRWCRNNEEQIWTVLIERKLLFSQDAMDIRKLMGIAPFTAFFTAESPGRTGVWTGWQIVRAYADRNPDLSLEEIMNNNDYQEILKGSRYNP